MKKNKTAMLMAKMGKIFFQVMIGIGALGLIAVLALDIFIIITDTHQWETEIGRSESSFALLSQCFFGVIFVLGSLGFFKLQNILKKQEKDK